jgi:hypothetical protein
MAEQRFSVPSAPTKTAATQRTSQRAVASNQTQRDCASSSKWGCDCAVVTLPDEIGGALAQRFGHPPAALGRELAYR